MAGTSNFPGSLDSHTSASPLGFGEVTNQANTLTTAAHTNSVTTVTVESTAAFPSKGYIVVKREIISYTGTTATTFTGCTRGVGGTTAAAFLTGSKVEQVPVAANHNDLAAAIVAVETVLGAGITTPNGVARKLAEATGTGSSATITFSSIPGTYRHLEMFLVGRSDAVANSTSVRLTFEATPTAGTYNYGQILSIGTTPSALENVGVNNYIIPVGIPAANAPANVHCTGRIYFPEYTNTDHYKLLVSHTFNPQHLVSGSLIAGVTGGIWESTAAIDRITLTLGAGNWTTTSVISLYGIPD